MHTITTGQLLYHTKVIPFSDIAQYAQPDINVCLPCSDHACLLCSFDQVTAT